MKKKSVVATIVAIVMVCACALVACGGKSSYEENREKLKNKYIVESATAPKGGIVFLGDSITDGYNIDNYFKDYKVYNRGISGDTTTNVLERLQDTCLVMQPKIINLLIGVNNLGEDFMPALNGIENILKEIFKSNKDTKVMLQNIYPVNRNKVGKFKGYQGCVNNNMIDAINVEIEKLAKKYNCIFVDMNKAIGDKNGDLLIECTYDGLHPNAKGYDIVSATLKPIVDKLAKECGII